MHDVVCTGCSTTPVGLRQLPVFDSGDGPYQVPRLRHDALVAGAEMTRIMVRDRSREFAEGRIHAYGPHQLAEAPDFGDKLPGGLGIRSVLSLKKVAVLLEMTGTTPAVRDDVVVLMEVTQLLEVAPVLEAAPLRRLRIRTRADHNSCWGGRQRPSRSVRARRRLLRPPRAACSCSRRRSSTRSRVRGLLEPRWPALQSRPEEGSPAPHPSAPSRSRSLGLIIRRRPRRFATSARRSRRPVHAVRMSGAMTSGCGSRPRKMRRCTADRPNRPPYASRNAMTRWSV